VERLPRQLLLQPDALGDVARVEDHAADLPVGAEVGHVRLEMPPFPEAVQQPEDDLGRLAVRIRRVHERKIVRVDEAGEVLAQQLPVPAAEHLGDGVACVAAAARAEDEHEVGRRGDEAAEVRGLAPRRSD
jgi:hypothetical protein